ncbi:MAG: phosphonate ABC transporter, permease protein PhnE [Hyphomicrobiales bacterium]|jgi:phosphonate transport system permease protein|nr:phosphonate ABC transporter, permease protein PhnE [Hyphomicrobiales bacterium]|tara:strand:- start:95 stop:973 length:879 start_codon:yes stop_codon:yes gene_type:complete
MNDSLLKRHITIYSEQLRSRRLWNIFIILIFAVSFFMSSSIIDFNLSQIIDGFPRLSDYIVKILPNLDINLILENSKTEGSIQYWYFNFKKYAALLYETFNMAVLATLMGFIFALILSFLSAKNITPNIYSYHLVKRILEFLRGVPEIIFAILFVWALGVGPLAGIIAITIHTTGALGKLFSEVHENADLKTCEAIRSHGGNWVSEMRYGIIPKVLPNIISYALLRFEINIRASTVIGFVGAGGIGQELYLVINFNYYEEVSAIILLIILTVITIDISSGRIRQKIIGEMGV